jgi:hypothetical protein
MRGLECGRMRHAQPLKSAHRVSQRAGMHGRVARLAEPGAAAWPAWTDPERATSSRPTKPSARGREASSPAAKRGERATGRPGGHPAPTVRRQRTARAHLAATCGVALRKERDGG